MDERQALRERLRNDLENFSKVMVPHIFKQKSPKFHKEMYKHLQEDTDRLCFVVFRGGAKSTLGVTLNCLWRVAYDKEKFIWVVAESTRQAVERLHDIKRELEQNNTFKALYGDFTTNKWSETEIVLENPETGHRCKICALGSGQRMRGALFEGSRLSLVILDDFESETNSETTELREKLVRWLYAALRPVFDPKDGRMLMLGTIVHPEAYLQGVRENPGDWKVLDYPIELDGSNSGKKPRWPERFGTKWITREKKDYQNVGKLSLFYQEYYNVPVASEERPFREELIKYYQGVYDKKTGSIRFEDDTNKPVNVVIGVDVAMGKKKGDFTSLSAVGSDRDGNHYTIRTYNKRCQPYELIQEIFRWNVDFSSPFGKPRFIIETVAMQELLISWLKQEERKRNTFILKKELRQRQGKEGENSRFLTIQPMHEAGVLFYRKADEELIGQMLKWAPDVKLTNDDLIDSYQMALSYTKPCKRNTLSYQEYQNETDNQTYNWATM